MRTRECLQCGMFTDAVRLSLDLIPPRIHCPKCDASLYLQHDGSCLTRDIAHHHETVRKALEKLDKLLCDGWRGYSQSLRIVVGGGLIREQVLGQLHYYQGQGLLRSYREESPNRGAIVVQLRA